MCIIKRSGRSLTQSRKIKGFVSQSIPSDYIPFSRHLTIVLNEQSVIRVIDNKVVNQGCNSIMNNLNTPIIYM